MEFFSNFAERTSEQLNRRGAKLGGRSMTGGGKMRVLDHFHDALAQKVAYVPGISFYPNADGGHNAMRLNFSYAPPELIVEGINRLGVALKKRLGAGT